MNKGNEASRMADATCKDLWWAFAQQSIDHAILLLDTGGVVNWASPGAVEILGVPASGLAGCTVERFFLPEDRDIGVPGQEIAVARSSGSAEDDRWMVRGDESRFWASGMMVALRDADGALTGFVKILRDLTDVKMKMETLGNRASALSAKEDHLRQAMAVLSHELRNPLASLGMATALLRKLVDQGDSRLHSPMRMLDRNIGFSARLLDDLDHALRISTGKLELQVERVPVRELLQSAIAAACERSEGRRPADIALLVPAVEIMFEADRLRMQQVFANLVGNAVKFTPSGERIWVNATVEGPQLVVRVEDAGIGIAPDKLEDLFEMFTQAHAKASRGLGIGLAVVKSIVELHGGSVQARSDGVGKGSTFTVRLPLRQREREDSDDFSARESNGG